MMTSTSFSLFLAAILCLLVSADLAWSVSSSSGTSGELQNRNLKLNMSSELEFEKSDD